MHLSIKSAGKSNLNISNVYSKLWVFSRLSESVFFHQIVQNIDLENALLWLRCSMQLAK